MPWFYVDDGFSDSKPVMSIPDHLVRVPMRLAVCGLWVLGGSWSAKEELDGFIPTSKLKSLRAPRAVIDAITGPGTLDAPLCDLKVDGIQVKNWQKWQPTKAEIESKRKREAEKKRNQRRRGRNFVTGIDDQMSPGDNPGDTTESSENVSPGESPSPNPTQPNPSSLVELSGGVTSVDASVEPRPKCSKHKENHDGPCFACGRRREWDKANPGVLANELERKRAAKEQLRINCPRCHGHNTYEDETGVHPCQPHMEAQ
ncbi:hypothetical protein [Mycobacterium dioxanotrophicus]|uniref:hypothetical protein n=1 Tax=Mycobacterium dioxanotrophicus TaxID=482462 RepID=UPI001E2D8699|nr:hypothetical protein [Mycobacterium dioxanotrophicus]